MTCPGLYYRVVEGAYVNARGTVRYWREYRLLKRRSCPGCAECKGLLTTADAQLWGNPGYAGGMVRSWSDGVVEVVHE